MTSTKVANMPAFVAAAPLLRPSLSTSCCICSRSALVLAAPQAKRAQRARTRRVEVNAMSATTDSLQSATSVTGLRTFLDACGQLGTLRFISVTNGAVLETIGRLDYSINSFDIPGKGEYLTIANDDKTFECHLRVSAVAYATISTNKAKIGDHELYVIRFKNADDNLLLSTLLQYDPSHGPGNYLFGAVDAFNDLQNQFGDRVQFAQ